MIPTRRMVHKGKVLVRQLSGSDAAKAQELATAAAASQQAAAIGSSSHSSSVPSVSQQALVGVHALSWALRDTPDKNTKERQVVLFNDCIIWASRAVSTSPVHQVSERAGVTPPWPCAVGQVQRVHGLVKGHNHSDGRPLAGSARASRQRLLAHRALALLRHSCTED